MKLSKRIDQLEPSVTLNASAKAKELKNQGKDVLILTVGEPDFVTPSNIQQAAIRSIQSGEASFYTAASGIPELRQAIIDRTEEDYGVTYQLNEVLVTTGAKYALYMIFQALLNEQEEVIIPAPYWVSYAEQVRLAGGNPVIVNTDENNQFKVTVPQLEKALTSKTKALLINSPCNPTGAIYSEDELRAIGEWAVAHDLTIISDDIYGKLVYNGNTFVPLVSLSDEFRRHTIVVSGVSKSYSMTGWRIGYILAESNIIQAIDDLASQSTGNPTAVSQYAALEALSGDQSSVETMRQAFEERLNKMYERVAALPGFKLEKPQGAFYLFPNVKEAMTSCGYTNVTDFVDDLLEEEYVALVTGEGFGASENIRFSYAADITVFDKAVDRIAHFLEKKTKK